MLCSFIIVGILCCIHITYTQSWGILSDDIHPNMYSTVQYSTVYTVRMQDHRIIALLCAFLKFILPVQHQNPTNSVCRSFLHSFFWRRLRFGGLFPAPYCVSILSCPALPALRLQTGTRGGLLSLPAAVAALAGSWRCFTPREGRDSSWLLAGSRY